MELVPAKCQPCSYSKPNPYTQMGADERLFALQANQLSARDVARAAEPLLHPRRNTAPAAFSRQ
eukprot:2075923-Prymnesium_polylepis.1